MNNKSITESADILRFNANGNHYKIVFLGISGRMLPGGINAGAENAAIQLAKRFAAMGAEISVVWHGLKDTARLDDIAYIPALSDSDCDAHRAITAADAVIAVTHPHALFAFDIPRNTRKFLYFPNPAFQRAIASIKEMGIVFSECDKCFVDSSFSRKKFLEAGCSPEKILLVNAGLDKNIFINADSYRKSIKLVYVGAIHPTKKAHIAIEAALELKSRGFEVELDVIGSPEIWNEQINYLAGAEIAAKAPYIRLLGELEQTEIAKILNDSSFLILPSDTGAFCHAAIEAQSCGCLPIAKSTFPISEIIEDEVNGFLLTEMLPNNIADTIISAIQNSEKTAQMRLNALRSAHKYDWDITASEIFKELHQVGTGKPLVSVIVPCYNYGGYLEQSVESIVAQTFDDWEIIIVNDGSTDNTIEISNKLIAKHKTQRIRLINLINRGRPSIVRNIGIAASFGDFVMCLDADDFIAPNYIEECINVFHNNPDISIVYSDQYHVASGKNVYQPSIDFSAELLKEKNLLPTAAMFRRKVWTETGGYCEDLFAYEDWNFWITAAAKGFIGKRVEKPLYYYRIHEGSLSSEAEKNDEMLKFKIILNNPDFYGEKRCNAAFDYFKKRNDQSRPIVSVIIPCYNQANFLAEAVESIARQSFRELEIIIVNDGSTDNTSEIALSLVRRFTEYRILLIEQENQGLPAARNVGIERSSGKYILPLDADDKIDRDFLAKTVDILEQQLNISIVYTDVQEFGEEFNIIPSIDWDFEKLCLMNYITATALFRREVWLENRGYKNEMKDGYEDWEFWLNAAANGFKGKRLPLPLFFYRKRSASMVNTKSSDNDKQLKAKIILFHKNFYSPKQIEWAKQVIQGSNKALALNIGIFMPVFDDYKHPAPAFKTAEHDSIRNSGAKMNILFTMYGWNESGGGTIYPRSVALELAARGHKVSVFYASLRLDPMKPQYSIEKTEESGVTLYGLYNRAAIFIDPDNPEREILDQDTLDKFCEVLNEVKPDVVHFNNFHGLTFSMAEETHKRGIHSCYTPHNYHLIDPNLYLFNNDLSLWNGIDLLQNSEAVRKNPHKIDAYKSRIDYTRKMLNEFIDITIAVSRRQRDLLLSHGCRPEHITVVHQANPAVESLYGNRLLEAASKREITSPLKIGFIGGVMAHKGVHLIAAAAQYFMPYDLEFHIYGFVGDNYLKLLKEVDKRSVLRFHGEYSHTALAGIGETLDLAIVPSVWEDCAPLVLLELLAMRLPVIAANIGGIPDFIKDGINGFLYQYDSVESLIQCIMYCTLNRDKIQAMRSGMPLYHTFSSYIEHIEKLYEALKAGKVTNAADFELTINFGSNELPENDVLFKEIKHIMPDEQSIGEYLAKEGMELISFERSEIAGEDSYLIKIELKAPKPVLLEEFIGDCKSDGVTTTPADINDRPKNSINTQIGDSSEFVGLSFDFTNPESGNQTQSLKVLDFVKEKPDTMPEINIVWEGSQFVYHSLALINREQCSNIIDSGVADLTIVPYEDDTFKPDGNEKYEKLKRFDIRFKQDPEPRIQKLPYVWIRHQWPPAIEPPRGAKWIIYQPWEYSKLQQDFVELFKQTDELWTPSTYSRLSFITSGIEPDKVQIIPNGIDPLLFKPNGDKFQLETKKRLKLLFVGGTIFRKGIDVLLNAYTKAFTNQDDVCLVIKDMGSDSFYKGQNMRLQIESYMRIAKLPEIIYLNHDLSEEEMAGLYRACDLFVSPYRGEGFSLPTLEAMACGLPVIVTEGGSTDDFVDDYSGWKIPSTQRSIGDRIGQSKFAGEAFVLEPDEQYLTNLLRDIYINPEPLRIVGIHAQSVARRLWTWKRATIKMFSRLDALYGLSLAAKAEKALSEQNDAAINIGIADELFAKHEFEKAEALFNESLRSGELNEEYELFARLRLSQICISAKDYDTAEDLLLSIDSDVEKCPDAAFLKAKIHAKRKEWAESLEIFTNLLNLREMWKYNTIIGVTHDDLLTGAADGIFATNDPESAFRLYDEALKMNNNNAEACLGLAKCFLEADLPEDARKMLEWALRIDPMIDEARELLGN